MRGIVVVTPSANNAVTSSGVPTAKEKCAEYSSQLFLIETKQSLLPKPKSVE
jgi:hypothetical protein